MKAWAEFLFLLPILLFLAGCDSQPENRRDLLPGFIGKPGEVLVIMEKRYWESDAGSVVKRTLDRNIYGMPTPEPMFHIDWYAPEHFDRYLRPHRNILFVEIVDNINYKEPITKVIKEKYSKDQVIVEMYAKSEAAFIEEFTAKADQIIDRINNSEVARIIQYNLKFGPSSVAEALDKHLHVTSTFLENSDVSALKDGFFWAHKLSSRARDGQMHDIQQGIVVYDFSYTSDSTFTVNYLLQIRDSVLRENLPGPSEDSYMQTELRYYPPSAREIEVGGDYAFEMRGLWRMENAFMGGPFLSVARVDTLRGRIVVAEGFVFAPKFDKREYLREVEAVVKSLKINYNE
jgi:hypothetical protein